MTQIAESRVPEDVGVSAEVLAFARIPILDRQGALFGYELQTREVGSEQDGVAIAASTGTLVEVFTNDQVLRLIGKSRGLVRCNREFLLGHADTLESGSNLGIIVGQEIGFDDDTLAVLEDIAGRGVLLLMDGLTRRDCVSPEIASRIADLMRHVRYVSLDARAVRSSAESMAEAIQRLHTLGIQVIAKHVDDHAGYNECRRLEFDCFQGEYLFRPESVDVGRLKPNKLNVLRLLAAVQDPDNGPVELEQLIRSDAVLSYKLLNCVNSAYFNLPTKMKSLQHAAIFFGVARIRNWVYAMSLGSMDDSAPELLKFALVRARMCELLGESLPRDLREQAFIVGLFSLLDTIMNAPMHFVLEQVPVSDEIRQALVEDDGPLAPLLGQVRAWETGYVVTIRNHAGNVVDLAEIYLGAAEWADEVYAFAGN